MMFGHREMQHAINAIIRLAEKAAKEPRPVPEDVHAPMRAKLKAAASAELASGVPASDQVRTPRRHRAVKKKFAAEFRRRRRRQGCRQASIPA